MSLLAVVVAGAESHADVLPFPPVVFAIISGAIFIALALVVWSFRDVANRHSHKTSGSAGHGTEHH